MAWLQQQSPWSPVADASQTIGALIPQLMQMRLRQQEAMAQLQAQQENQMMAREMQPLRMQQAQAQTGHYNSQAEAQKALAGRYTQQSAVDKQREAMLQAQLQGRQQASQGVLEGNYPQVAAGRMFEPNANSEQLGQFLAMMAQMQDPTAQRQMALGNRELYHNVGANAAAYPVGGGEPLLGPTMMPSGGAYRMGDVAYDNPRPVNDQLPLQLGANALNLSTLPEDQWANIDKRLGSGTAAVLGSLVRRLAGPEGQQAPQQAPPLQGGNANTVTNIVSQLSAPVPMAPPEARPGPDGVMRVKNPQTGLWEPVPQGAAPQPQQQPAPQTPPYNFPLFDTGWVPPQAPQQQPAPAVQEPIVKPNIPREGLMRGNPQIQPPSGGQQLQGMTPPADLLGVVQQLVASLPQQSSAQVPIIPGTNDIIQPSMQPTNDPKYNLSNVPFEFNSAMPLINKPVIQREGMMRGQPALQRPNNRPAMTGFMNTPYRLPGLSLPPELINILQRIAMQQPVQ